MSLTVERRAELFAACQLFGGLDAGGLGALAAVAQEIEFPAGHVIARQDDIGTGFFVVVSGRVRVIREGTTLATLGPGDFFGELSVIDHEPRNASVVAAEPVVCLALASWDFDAVLLAEPAIAVGILRGIARRLRTATSTIAAARH
jgi:CRP/FNR family cyclic AMP-dependent transcriptional regulator